jgi:hypothetical protein
MVGPTRRRVAASGHRRHRRADPTARPTTPQPQTMTVRVFFHEQAPGPESDPGRVVPVSRTAALNDLLCGPTTRERAAGHWSFFSDDTAGMLRSVCGTGGTGFADFRDVRRLIPNATSSYGSTALLAELDAALKQFRPSRAACTPSTATCPRSTPGSSPAARRCRLRPRRRPLAVHPERTRRRPGHLASGRLDRIEGAGLARQCPRRPGRWGTYDPGRRGMARPP